ncbi:MAG: MBL fold metallo-hydrolase [Candidatus Margulisiibacteriota bacterium]|jgi:glyoxylase-like metal-dependent hydrolase (beta-lactamase superfamily II)
MKFEVLKVGPLSANCYIVWDEPTKIAIVIDPGGQVPNIMKIVQDNHLTVREIINTHGHFDHVSRNGALKKETGAKLLRHELDSPMAEETDPTPADEPLRDGELIVLGQTKFKVIHTPGHSPGGICLFNEEDRVLFSGDTLFRGTYGRVDLFGSSAEAMVSSLKKLMQLPPETKVYPGHGRPTTIGEEKETRETAN